MAKKSKGVKGESSFDSSTRKVRKFDNTPMPVKVYEGKVLPGWTIEKAAGKGKLPYLQGKIEALNSSSTKGGKNRKLTQRFFLNTTPNEKGNSHIDSGDQIVAYTKAIDARFKCKTEPATKIDDKGVKHNVNILNPDSALKFIEGTAGTVFKFKSKNEPSNKPGDDTLWPAVANFIEADPDEEKDEDEDEEGEEEETDEDDEEGEEEDGEEDEDEDDDEESDEEESDDEDEDEDDDEEDDEDDDEEDDEDSDEDDDEEDSDDEDEDEEEPVKKGKAKAKKAPAKKKGKK